MIFKFLPQSKRRRIRSHLSLPSHKSWMTAVCLCASLCSLEGFARPLSVEDILGLEDVGSVTVAVDGSTVLFERIASSLARRDFSIDDPRWSADIYVHRVGEHGPAEPLLRSSGESGRWLGGLSPSGRRVALFRRILENVQAGVYDFTDRREVWFGFTPYVDFSQEAPVWLSDDELVYSILPEGMEPSSGRFRASAANRLSKAWLRAWQGTETTADVLRVGSPGEVMRNGRLVRVNWRTGNVRVISDGILEGLRVSPNGRYLVGVQRGALREPTLANRISVGQGPYWFDIQLFDLSTQTGPVHVCPGCDVAVESIRWNGRSSGFAFFARRADETWSRSLFYLYSPDQRSLNPIEHTGLDLVSQRESGGEAIPEAAVPLAGGLIIAARAQGNASLAPLFTDQPYRPSGLKRADWYFVRSNSVPRNLTSSLNDVSPKLLGVVGAAVYIVADGAIWLIAPDGIRKKVCCAERGVIDLGPSANNRSAETGHRGGAIVARFVQGKDTLTSVIGIAPNVVSRFQLPKGAGRIVATSSDARTIVLRSSTSTNWALSTAGASSRPDAFWSFNSHLANVTPVRSTTVRYRIPGGDVVESCVMLPDRRASTAPMPAVVHIYPRSTASCPNAYANGVIDFYEPELLARLGYVVLFPYAPEQRLRGSNGPLTNWSELVNPAVDAAVSAGYVDKERVGVFGLSFGAISTLELLAQNGRFRTAVASHGAANFTSHYGALSLVRRLLPSDYFAIGQSVGYESRGSYLSLQSTPWDEADLYVRSSPFFDVNKIHTPLLLMHSDLDPNFQMEQFDEVFTALFRLGRDVEYVRYWGEGHGLNSPANVRDMWVRLKNWYEKYLDPETMESAGNGSN